MAGKIPIICATIAFGMGVDKSDIRYIYHYHLAKGFDSYLQETGRDGQPAASAITSLVNELLDADEIDITALELSKAHDIRPLVVSTLLTHLELFEIIKFDGYYSDIRFAANQTSTEILAGYKDNQVAFLKKIFASCQKARKWITLNIDTAIEKTGQPRDVILRAMESLQEKGAITLQMSGYRQRFIHLNRSIDRTELCAKLTKLFSQHEQLEIERIQGMVAYAQESTCLTNKLLSYFGEPIEPCGHCGVCLGDAPATLAKRHAPPIKPDALSGIAELAEQYPSALGQPRQQARFLCGLNSPAVTKERALRGNALFGASGQVPFQTILNALTT